MRRRYIVISIIILIVVIAGLFIFRDRIGDIRPALLPSSRDITDIVGDDTTFSLQVPSGFRIGVFAKDLGKARDLQFTPKGTLLVSDPTGNRVLALPDRDNDGKADEVKEILTNLDKPHGLAFFFSEYDNGNEVKLFVAEESKVVRYNWDEDNLIATFDKKLFDLPKGGRHSTRTLAINMEQRLFVSIGSSCDVCFEDHPWFGSVIISNTNGDTPKVFTKGLRNSVFITINPATTKLWGTEMGRDFLGDDLPPDEINIIAGSAEYGWPRCYGDRIHDLKFDHNHEEEECNSTRSANYNIQAHSAPLGLEFIFSEKFPKDWRGDLLVAYHGSWNRSTPVGYKVVRMRIEGGQIIGEEDFVTGFLEGSDALGRPVDVTFDSVGNLYISDDKTGAVYKVVAN